MLLADCISISNGSRVVKGGAIFVNTSLLHYFIGPFDVSRYTITMKKGKLFSKRPLSSTADCRTIETNDFCRTFAESGFGTFARLVRQLI